MADLDVTELLEDPDFADVFTVTRRTDTVNNKGRSVVSTRRYRNVLGVCQPADPSDNVRTDDSQMTNRHLNIVTRFRMHAASDGGHPDQVQMVGDPVVYTVKSVKPWTRFGAGFVKVTLESQNAADTPA